MNWFLKNGIVLLTVLSLFLGLCVPCFARDSEKDDIVIAGQMTGDALIARPLGLCATVVGSTLFIASLPFSLLGRNTGDAFDFLVAGPFKFTFARPLGNL